MLSSTSHVWGRVGVVYENPLNEFGKDVFLVSRVILLSLSNMFEDYGLNNGGDLESVLTWDKNLSPSYLLCDLGQDG